MIRRTVALLWALSILAWATPALAQPVNLPAQTVWGRLGIGAGPGQAIPFANFVGNTLAAVTGDCTVTVAGVITCSKTSGNPIAQLTFATQAAAVLATIPSSVTAIYLEGNITTGVGPANYIRVGGNPGHSAFFQSADGAFWALNEKVVSLEMFGGGSNCSTGSFNNTTALNTYQSYMTVKGSTLLLLGGCQYTFNSQPNAFAPTAPWIQGSGLNNTTILRNFNGSAGVGFIQITGASGAMLRGFALNAADGTTGGDMINIKATSVTGSDGSVIEDISISPAGSADAYVRGFVIDGSAKVTGAIGTRDTSIRNLNVFGASDTSVYLLDTIGLSWNGGGAFVAGGTGSFTGGMQAIGSVLFTPAYLDVKVFTFGGNVSLQFCTSCTVMTSVFGGTVTLDANTTASTIIGKVTSTFTNSGGATNCLYVNGTCSVGTGPGGSNGQVQTNNGGASFNGITNTQLTALINPATASLPGSLAASAMAAWTTYTPTITASSGTFTTVSATGRFMVIGKTVHISIVITDTTNGSAAGNLIATLPTSPALPPVLTNTYVLSGFNGSTGTSAVGNVSTNGSGTVIIFKYDGTFPIGTGQTLWVSGVYEGS